MDAAEVEEIETIGSGFAKKWEARVGREEEERGDKRSRPAQGKGEHDATTPTRNILKANDNIGHMRRLFGDEEVAFLLDPSRPGRAPKPCIEEVAPRAPSLPAVSQDSKLMKPRFFVLPLVGSG